MFQPRKAVLAATMAAAATVGAQPVYKWVDAQGRTHYGNQMPDAQTPAEAMKLSPGSGSSGGTPAPAPRKAVPKEVREFAEGLAKGLMKVQPSPTLSCPKAVDNAVSGIDTMLEVGEKNMRDGYLDPAQYQPVAGKLRAIRGRISLAECESSSGAVREFYQCMTSSYNHVAACGDKHKYGE